MGCLGRRSVFLILHRTLRHLAASASDRRRLVERPDSVAHVFESHRGVQPHVERQTLSGLTEHRYRRRRSACKRLISPTWRAVASRYFSGGGNLTITNNAAQTNFTVPTLAIGPNTVIGTPGFGGIVVTGTGTTTIDGSIRPRVESSCRRHHQDGHGASRSAATTPTMVESLSGRVVVLGLRLLHRVETRLHH